MYSKTASYLAIIAMHRAGLDIESIARRLRTDVGRDGRLFTRIDIHNVAGAVGLYTTFCQQEQRRSPVAGATSARVAVRAILEQVPGNFIPSFPEAAGDIAVEAIVELFQPSGGQEG